MHSPGPEEARTGLSVVRSDPVVCPPWEVRHIARYPVFGDVCAFCTRDVAAPTERRFALKVCIYCALDRGLIPAIDAPLDEAGDLIGPGIRVGVRSG